MLQKKIVSQFEDLKISLSGLAKLSDINLERKLPVFLSYDNPVSVADKVPELLMPRFKKDPKKFLNALIDKFALYNIWFLNM
ncbi:hypothetical protein ACFOUP_12050 [Belliella kenyensis]|uniref:Uncharacterized protein n=1 Tax=Belliella kenyensis TaxID=1472724 RepID=A0ABV8ELE3_9BACT|nr:hypothetical protein [Belliella kenyensis]MCH7400697.1 hypothetical protein [Belliella kenyensis]MDN3602016.1 hypothetical protein [Belliella kenyensis]